MTISVTGARTSHTITTAENSWKRWNFWTTVPAWGVDKFTFSADESHFRTSYDSHAAN